MNASFPHDDAAGPMKTPPRRRQRGDFTTQFGAFLILVVFPATFTAVAPRTTVQLHRDGANVSATVSTHTLLVIPYWRQVESRVNRIEVEIDEGERVGYNAHLSEDMNRVNRRGRTEDSAVIHFRGEGEGASAMIELGQMNEVAAQAQTFLDDPNSQSLDFTFYAHRVIGLYVGLPVSLLALLYLPLLGLAIVRKVLKRPYWPFA